MRRADLLALAGKAEGAEGQGDIIIAAAEAIDSWEQWRVDRVRALCLAGAFLDAAALLVPAGWAWSLYGGAREEGNATAYCVPRGAALPWPAWVTDIDAATPALALTAAALRARAEEADDER